MLPLPGLVAYALLSGKFLPLLKKKEIYLGVISFVLVLGSYYYFREQVNPGYWQAVQENELGGRFLQTLEEHNRPWYFYLTGDKFMPWLLLILPAIFMAFRFAQGLTRRFAFFATTFFFGFLLIISVSQTKLLWYAAPLYPMGAMLVAVGLFYAFRWLTGRFNMQRPGRFIFISSVLLFGTVYGLILGRVASQPRRDRTDLTAADSYFMKAFHRKFPRLKKYTFLSENSYNSSLDFYLLKYRHEGYTITDKRDKTQTHHLQTAEIVLTCSPAMKAELIADYEAEKLLDQDNCIAIRVIRKK